ncbi:hypothetical protein ACD661_11815 [Legionella lytica]|uniref:Arylamine N-acetyltransferase n=1 Tax=Legionella lytica TaxID=96232 RepID=A0ABW8D947_9GAMM
MGKEKTELSSFLIDIKPQTTIVCEEIIERLNQRLKEHLFTTAYNNIGMFFQQRQSAPNFQLDSFAHYEQFSSGNCIGLTLGLIQHILNYCRNWEAIMRLPPMYVIPATLPSHYERTEEFGHVALLVACSDGLILLDSGFHLHQGIVLKNDEEVSLSVGDKTWRFRLEQQIHPVDKKILRGTIQASVETSRFGREQFQYTLRHISNPDGIILKRNMVDARRVSYVRRDWDGLQTNHVTVCLREQSIKMAFLKKDRISYQKIELSFTECHHAGLDFYLQLYGCPPSLVRQISSLIQPYIQSPTAELAEKNPIIIRALG